MAVAVAEHSVVVLDEDDRVVEELPPAQGHFGVYVPKSPLDELPSARAAFGPYFARARHTGEPVEFAEFVDGRVVQVAVVPEGRRLVVTWHTLGILDVLTLDGLRTSLAAIIETLAHTELALERSATRRSLRLVEGGL